eukprot:scaffold9735_cov174-Amphora_coffeaeformis.AAC.1
MSKTRENLPPSKDTFALCLEGRAVIGTLVTVSWKVPPGFLPFTMARSLSLPSLSILLSLCFRLSASKATS